MKLIIIAALSRNRVIARDGKLPWRIPEDLRRFKRLTLNHTLLMGRTTYESLGKPLPQRRNVVLTSRPIEGIETYPSVEAALEALHDQDELFIIGGGKVYAEFIDRADAMHLTHVDREVEGDTFFPPYEHLIGTRYRLVIEEKHEGFVFRDYILKESAQ